MNWYFFFFFISGFCSVLYELVWLRLAMAQFGVTTAMVSIVLSVFMCGLGLGAWASGRWLGSHASDRFSALRLYALIELLIGISGLLVPQFFLLGRRVLEHGGPASSFGYYCAAGLWVAFSLTPWCALMGATLPVAMRAIARSFPAASTRSFSYLYMANVAGAVAGTDLPLFLIELLGFRGTLKIAVACNFLITASALALSGRTGEAKPAWPEEKTVAPVNAAGGRRMLLLLVLSGLTSMGMEVVWVRSYTPYFGTVVYAFASLLGAYLLATVAGSALYRRWSVRHSQENPLLWTWLAACALFPLLATSPTVRMADALRLALGVIPFTGLLGFITPMLVDRYSSGNPSKAGVAYAINVAGCILGPLLAGFGLLPFLSEHWALVILALPWLVLGLAPLLPSARSRLSRRATAGALFAMSAVLMAAGKGFEKKFPQRKVLRDATATVIATGTGMDKDLLVNGFGMTNLTPITKVMAHLPLASLDRQPQDALVICFGMGTTFRSLRSWGIPVTAVELVPSVPRLFSYYHDDGDRILASPLSHVVIDDGRRYLERTQEQYDVITIDPPPPLQAAGSSLLYSTEFYRVARRRLRPGGVLQQWIPATSDEDAVDVAAVARSLRDSFPYVRAFPEEFGIHFLCSDRPIAKRDATQLVQRMPPAAVSDLVEWDPPLEREASGAAEERLGNLLKAEFAVDPLIAASPATPALTDDRPVNEYYVLREWLAQHAAANMKR